MLHLQQELFLVLQDTLLDLDMILHQFPPLSAQIDRFLQTTIVMIILKLPINITIHLIITFILHQTQLPIQISTEITLKLKQLQQHKTPSYNYTHTTASQNIYSQNQGISYPSTSYSHITQASQRRLQNPPLTHITIHVPQKWKVITWCK